MKRYDIDCDCDGGHIAGDLFDTEDADGYYTRAGDVIEMLNEAISISLEGEEAVLEFLCNALADLVIKPTDEVNTL